MAPSGTLSKANTNFCLDLLKQLSDNKKTANVFFSPFSISSALAMVMLGARCNTATQMSEVLRFLEAQQPLREGVQVLQQLQQQQRTKPQCCEDDVHADYNQLLTELNKPDAQYILSVANKLYGEQTYEFVEDFLEKTKKHYKAELKAVDFKNNHEAARLAINTWVESQTQGKIKDLLAKDMVDTMSKLVLVNAIYFKGKWLEQFKESETTDAQFRINKNETKPVKMMHMHKSFSMYIVDEFNLQILELPYKGSELSMLIFLPMSIEDNSTGLEKLEKLLTYDKFMEWTSPDATSLYDVDLSLPRFKMEEKYDMKDVLVSMGMVDAFDMDMSDFSGMSHTNELVLSKVVHKAFVDVNEEGTEAAAATAAIMMLGCVFKPRVTFNADHPFLFFIRHNVTMSILFAGRFCSPN
ncbi:leukocyte elastase inhibitor-like [Solea solea]|uniref:leukocyte elastase inhibitor-like n=1 Tax=Solea solea TaxID=90069 RepID=UPI00272B7CF6|nr:leukocyte elastase inhibitor-like [Solea solea]